MHTCEEDLHFSASHYLWINVSKASHFFIGHSLWVNVYKVSSARRKVLSEILLIILSRIHLWSFKLGSMWIYLLVIIRSVISMLCVIHISFKYSSTSIMCNYEWAKRTKFLLAAIYGSARRHSIGSKTFWRNRKKKFKSSSMSYLGLAESFKRWTGPTRPGRNALWCLISQKVYKIGTWNFETQSSFKSSICAINIWNWYLW